MARQIALACLGAFLLVAASSPALAAPTLFKDDTSLLNFDASGLAGLFGKFSSMSTCKAQLTFPLMSINAKNGTCPRFGRWVQLPALPGKCVAACPGNSTLYDQTYDATTNTTTCTLKACPTYNTTTTARCGSYCMKTADANSLSSAGQCDTVTNVLNAYGAAIPCIQSFSSWTDIFKGIGGGLGGIGGGLGGIGNLPNIPGLGRKAL